MKTYDQKRAELNIQHCHEEKVHIPGWIQDRGWLLAVDKQTNIRHVSANMNDLCESPDLIGQSLDNIPLLSCLLDQIKSGIRASVIDINGQKVLSTCLPETNGLRVFELENMYSLPNRQGEHFPVAAYEAAATGVNSLDALYPIIVNAVKEIATFDRVLLYRFDEHWNGQVVAESAKPGLESYLHLCFPASDIPAQVRALYYLNKIRVIYDIESEEVAIHGQDDRPLDLTHSTLRGVSPFHVQYLQNMGVRGSMSFALFNGAQLWGLVTSHCIGRPNNLDRLHINKFELLSHAISADISRITSRREMAQVSDIMDTLSRRDIDKLLNMQEDARNFLQQIRHSMSADAVLLLAETRHLTSHSLSDELIDDMWKVCRSLQADIVYTSSFVADGWGVNTYRSEYAGAAVLCIVGSEINTASNLYLVLLRKEEAQSVMWAGEQGNAGKTLTPRQSFETWKEEKKHHCHKWSGKDKAVLGALKSKLQNAALQLYAEENRRKNELIMESSKIGIWTLDIVNNEMSWNKGMYDIYGVPTSRSVMTYEDWKSRLLKEDAAGTTLNFEQSLQDKHTYDATFRIWHPRKGERTIRAHAGYLEDGEGNIVKVIGTNADITESTQLRKRLKQQQKVIKDSNKLAVAGKLAANIGHEINNPLAVISGNLSILSEYFQYGYTCGEEQERMLKSCEDSVRRIGTIVQGLKSLAYQSEAEEQITVTVDLSRVLSSITSMMRPLYLKEGINLRYQGTSRQCLVVGNEMHIHQVVLNILDNARDAIQVAEDKSIELRIKLSQNTAVLSVKDSGAGMSETTISRIFETFYTSKGIGKGTGIGLSVVKSLMQGMGGEIRVSSTEGEGSEFLLSFQRAIGSVSEETREATLEKAGSVSCLDVLLVEDEPELLSLISQILMVAGHQVTVAEDPRAALKLCEGVGFDAVITDMTMPTMSGSEFLQTLNEQPFDWTKNVCRIVMTGDVMISQDSLAQEGVDVYRVLYKPFEANQMIEALNHYFSDR